MNPNGTSTITFAASDGGTPTYEYVEDNNTTEYLSSSTNGERIIVDLEAPSVAEADIDMSAGITVTLKLIGIKTLLGAGTVTAQQGGTSADGSSISNGSDSITFDGTWTTYSGTAETTSDGMNAWVYGDLAGLYLRVNQFRSPRFGENRVAYLYAEVEYTPAAVDENAIFFGSNF
jgi:hypothetical protein